MLTPVPIPGSEKSLNPTDDPIHCGNNWLTDKDRRFTNHIDACDLASSCNFTFNLKPCFHGTRGFVLILNFCLVRRRICRIDNKISVNSWLLETGQSSEGILIINSILLIIRHNNNICLTGIFQDNFGKPVQKMSSICILEELRMIRD